MKALLRMICCLLSLAAASMACSHPIVSTDINRHVTLQIGTTDVAVHYIYEMLEIAAVNVGRHADADANGTVGDAEREEYARAWGEELAGALKMRFDGQPVRLILQAVKWTLSPAPFGLQTWTLTADLQGQWPAGARAGPLVYEDGLRPDETGWKEIVLAPGAGVRVQDATGGTEDRSARLKNYAAMADLPNPEQVSLQAELYIATVAAGAMDHALKTAGAVRTSPAADATGSTKPPAPAAAPVTPATAPILANAAAPASGPEFVPVTASVAAASPQALADAAAWWHYVEPFFRLGMHHIATGWDHLAFLLGLLLFRQTLRHLLWVVTAFTLAHSITLALAALGWVTPPGAAIEALIALSIAYVGAMALWKPQLRHGPWIALGFGLIHGFGFAGALGETLGEVDSDGWLVALASFNLGIEVLQLLLVAAAYGLLTLSDRLTSSGMPRKLLAAMVLAAGSWWTLERSLLA